jgi:hypothetical protein
MEAPGGANGVYARELGGLIRLEKARLLALERAQRRFFYACRLELMVYTNCWSSFYRVLGVVMAKKRRAPASSSRALPYRASDHSGWMHAALRNSNYTPEGRFGSRFQGPPPGPSTTAQ